MEHNIQTVQINKTVNTIPCIIFFPLTSKSTPQFSILQCSLLNSAPSPAVETKT